MSHSAEHAPKFGVTSTCLHGQDGKVCQWKSCHLCFPFLTKRVFNFSQIWSVDRRKKKRKEAKFKKKKVDEHSKSAFSQCFLRAFSWAALTGWFSLYRIIREQHLSNPTADGFSRPAYGCCMHHCGLSSCTVGQLLGREIMHITCGIHLGGGVAFHSVFGLNTSDHRLCCGP